MPTTLTGVSTGITDGGAVSVNGPADGDPSAAASVNTPLQYLLNRAKYLLDFVTKTHTWTALQTFSAGLAGTTATLTSDGTVGGNLVVNGAGGVTVASAADYKFASAKTRNAWVLPAEMKAATTGANRYYDGLNELDPTAHDAAGFIQNVNGTEAKYFAVATRLPPGATITGMAVEAQNSGAADYTFYVGANILPWSSGSSILTGQERIDTGGNSGTAVLRTAGSARITSTIAVNASKVVPEDGLVWVYLKMPAGGPVDFSVQIFGIRFTYTYTKLTD